MNIIEFSEYLKNTNLKEELTNRIKLFEELTSQPITGTPSEGCIFNALKAVGIKSEWSAMSHADFDMVIEYNGQRLNVSLKGCKENKSRISWSSYRTTSAKTLNEKLDLIEKLDAKLDLMLILSRYHTGKNVFPDYYKMYLINPHNLNPKNYTWKDDVYTSGELKGYRTCKNELDLNMGIVLKMSSQLWADCGKANIISHPDMITEVMEIKTNVSNQS